jgi:FkbM family methyltransferase
MSNIEITPGGWAILDDDFVSCSADVRRADRIDLDAFDSITFCRPYWHSGDTVLDVGAHIGCWSEPMANAVYPYGRVIAFEPDPELFACLKRNLARSGQVCLNVAVWSSSGTVTFLRNPANRGASAIKVSENIGGNVPIEVPSVRLDDMGLSNVGFIKVDVEGAELHVLKGAEQLIAENRPILFVETVASVINAFGYTLEEMYDWLRAKGYSLTFHPLNIEPAHDVLCIPAT